ncbi:MAG TPA: TIR-like protein FxsC [Vicinamibacterales bacterium]|jgi:FxsC-like protein|nr:TIR-like protein FxsC [Vicinamibacterales bacterium]
MNATAATPPQAQLPYFFLSYAHTPHSGSDPREDPDRGVGEFFRDLSDAVADLTDRAGREGRSGFIDRELAAGSNWQRYLSAALETCQTFVALYAPRYFSSTAAGREWTSFHRRLQISGVRDVASRYIPVLWNPLQPGYPLPPGVPEPLTLDEVPEYREHGLQALRRLPRFRGAYDNVVAVLARKIVTLAERHPIEPGTVPDLDDGDLDFPRGRTLQPFVIVVVADTAKQLSDGALAGYYGETAAEWRPYGPKETLPLARYATSIAEWFGFSSLVTGLDQARELLATAPGVALIDPWHPVASTPAGLRKLTSLPRWTVPVVVFSHDDPRLAGEGAGNLGPLDATLTAAHPPRTEAARHAAEGIDDLADFDELFPILVTDAARRYLRQGPVYPPRGPAAAPSPVFNP